MPVEIRELIIKTEIRTATEKVSSLNDNDFTAFREEVMEMCKRILSEGIKRTNYRR